MTALTRTRIIIALVVFMTAWLGFVVGQAVGLEEGRDICRDTVRELL